MLCTQRDDHETSLLANNRSDMLASQCWIEQMWFQPVYDLKFFQLAGVSKEIKQHTVERQCLQVPLSQLAYCNVFNELCVAVGLGVRIVKAVNVFDKRMSGATVALRKEKTAGAAEVEHSWPRNGMRSPPSPAC